MKTILDEIVSQMDEELKTASIPDYSGAMNGLQITNNGMVTKIASAVDSSLPVIKKAVEVGADLLIVHHGLFWQGAQAVVGATYEKLKLALDSNLAVYSSHIPLDVHGAMGNNALLAEAIGLGDQETFFDWKGIHLGRKGEFDGDFNHLIAMLEDVLGSRVHYCKQGEEVGMVGLITGGAGSEVAEMAKLGVKTFITGEGPHWSYGLAEELGVNVIYAGHYATETFGVKALSKWAGTRIGAPVEFVDHPTGL